MAKSEVDQTRLFAALSRLQLASDLIDQSGRGLAPFVPGTCSKALQKLLLELERIEAKLGRLALGVGRCGVADRDAAQHQGAQDRGQTGDQPGQASGGISMAAICLDRNAAFSLSFAGSVECVFVSVNLAFARILTDPWHLALGTWPFAPPPAARPLPDDTELAGLLQSARATGLTPACFDP